jgi:hypothetical protein
LKFGQAIVDAIFVQKILNFWKTYGLVLAPRCTNFYEIPISILGAMPQKQFFLKLGQLGQPKNILFLTFWVGFFFINS